MQTQRNGFLLSGHWIVDRVKMVDLFPKEESLAIVTEQSLANGGGAFNVAKDLSLMETCIPLEGIGLLGDDADGEWVLTECHAHGIDTRQLHKLAGENSAFTDVITVQDTGKRTFFTYKGATGKLAAEHFDFSSSQAKIFYLAYIGFLDSLDHIPGPGQLPGSAVVLQRALAQGMITTVDLVSCGSDFTETVTACIPYVDYFFANDLEAEKLTGVAISEKSGAELVAALAAAAKKIVERGVRQACILHVPGGVVAATAKGEVVVHPSVKVPRERIKGTNGCGDAFAAGVLYGVHENFPLQQSLELGLCMAAQCLLSASSSGAIENWQTCLARGRELGFREGF